MHHGIVATTLLLAACYSPPAALPGNGAGMIAFDPSPPDGAATWPQPALAVGDHFVLLRGGKARLGFTVAEANERGYVLVDDHGGKLRRGPDLANFGEWPNEGEDPLHALAPADYRFHWPLWLGKRWRCQYVDSTAGGASLPIESSYVVEDLDSIATPAGTFEALRIVRTSRLLLEGGPYLDRVMVIWYAPAIGLEVRQVFGDTAVEMIEWRAAAKRGQ